MDRNYGICRILLEALDQIDPEGAAINMNKLSTFFPEFKKLKEEFGINANEEGYWWDIETDRTPFFEAMIEEATNKSKNINKIL